MGGGWMFLQDWVFLRQIDWGRWEGKALGSVVRLGGMGKQQ